MNQKLLLASASPRRAELIQQLGWQPVVKPVDIDESVQLNEDAESYCLRMAEEKLAAALASFDQDLPILAADTIVVLGDEILGKPRDAKAAELTLVQLAASTHQVYSAVAIHYAGRSLVKLSKNEVTMSQMQAAEIADYVATGEPMDKAGSYGIQGLAAQWIQEIRGSYSGIMGLPLFETSQILKQLGAYDASQSNQPVNS